MTLKQQSVQSTKPKNSNHKLHYIINNALLVLKPFKIDNMGYLLNIQYGFGSLETINMEIKALQHWSLLTADTIETGKTIRPRIQQTGAN